MNEKSLFFDYWKGRALVLTMCLLLLPFSTAVSFNNPNLPLVNNPPSQVTSSNVTNINNTYITINGSSYNITYSLKAGTGNCPAGYVVQNTTAGGVQCVQQSTGNSSWNQDLADTLYYSITNPQQFINITGIIDLFVPYVNAIKNVNLNQKILEGVDSIYFNSTTYPNKYAILGSDDYLQMDGSYGGGSGVRLRGDRIVLMNTLQNAYFYFNVTDSGGLPKLELFDDGAGIPRTFWYGEQFRQQGYIEAQEVGNDQSFMRMYYPGTGGEVQFIEDGNRKQVFGYDENLNRGIFYNDQMAGGMYFWDNYGLALGYDPNGYNSNSLGIDKGTASIHSWTKHYFGSADQSSIRYDGTNMVINPKEVGSGIVQVLGDLTANNLCYLGGVCNFSNLFVTQNITTKNIILSNASGSGKIVDDGTILQSTTGGTNVLRNTNITGNLVITGNLSVKRPYLVASSNQTQNFLDTANTQVITINLIEDNYLMNITGNENISVSQTGDYVCTLMPLFTTGVANKHAEFWIEHNNGSGWAQVPRSNTRIEISAPNVEVAQSITFQMDMTPTDKMRFMWWSDSTSTQLLDTPIASSPTRPEVPSIILNCFKQSELT